MICHDKTGYDMAIQRNIEVVIAFVMSYEPERCEGSRCGLFEETALSFV
jgi:hypothetical protein